MGIILYLKSAMCNLSLKYSLSRGKNYYVDKCHCPYINKCHCPYHLLNSSLLSLSLSPSSLVCENGDTHYDGYILHWSCNVEVFSGKHPNKALSQKMEGGGGGRIVGLPKPKAILLVSAHWDTSDPTVNVVHEN